jgi:hypothetical protein
MAISNRLPRLVLALAALAPAAACDTPVSTTGLNPEGPPMIQQVFMKEPDASGRLENVLAFGTHSDVPTDRTHAAAKAAPLGQRIRIVFDELLLGNYLEEVQCHARNGVSNCPQWSHVPEGTTPEDIARCATQDTLDALCAGEHAVCLNPEGTACGIEDDPTSDTRPADGAPDDLRLIPGAVKIVCGDIEVGFDEASSFWQPAGNQLVPAGLVPENSLGPALVLIPALGGSMPTSQSDCRVVFAANVVDKDHIAVCTPEGGTLDGACTPGDVGAFKFGTEVMKETSHVPFAEPGDTVSVASAIRISLNASVDEASLRASVTVKENGVVTNDFAAYATGADKNIIEIKIPASVPINSNPPQPNRLKPDTTYEITVTPKDSFGIAAPTPITFTFRTIGA